MNNSNNNINIYNNDNNKVATETIDTNIKPPLHSGTIIAVEIPP